MPQMICIVFAVSLATVCSIACCLADTATAKSSAEADKSIAEACAVGCRIACGTLNTQFASICIDARKHITVAPLDRPECIKVCVSDKHLP
jgi:hypothetical protein